MGEEEAARRIVRVCVFFGVLVMHPVIPRPVVDGALIRQRGTKHQKHSDTPMRLVGAMGPQTVRPTGDAELAVKRSGRARDGMRGTEVYSSIRQDYTAWYFIWRHSIQAINQRDHCM